MFQICILDLKNSRKGNNITLFKLFLNAMIINIKIQNILDIIEN